MVSHLMLSTSEEMEQAEARHKPTCLQEARKMASNCKSTSTTKTLVRTAGNSTAM